MAGYEKARRLLIEEIDNGYLVKITMAGSDKLVGRYAFWKYEAMLDWLREQLSKDK